MYAEQFLMPFGGLQMRRQRMIAPPETMQARKPQIMHEHRILIRKIDGELLRLGESGAEVGT